MKVGFAEVDITPPAGLAIAGSGRRSVGVKAPLLCRAAVFEKAAIVQPDIIGLQEPHVGEARRLIRAATGLPMSRIMIACPQNHCAPETIAASGRLEFANRRHEAWFRRLLRSMAEAAARALESAAAGRMACGKSSAKGIGGNRRPVLRSGKVRTLWYGVEPDEIADEGPEDNDVFVLRFSDDAGRLLGIVFSYTCHPNTTWATPYFNTDYYGAAIRILKRWYGRSIPFVFLNGACGNIDGYKYLRLPQKAFLAPGCFERGSGAMRTYAEADRYGTLLARAVRRCLDSLPEGDEVRRVTVLRGSVRLKRLKPNVPQAAEVQVIVLNDTAVVGVPGDYFVELGLWIKKHSPFARTIISAHTNGFLGYLPTREAYEQGGYEVGCDFTNHAPGCGEAIAEKAVELLRKAAGGP